MLRVPSWLVAGVVVLVGVLVFAWILGPPGEPSGPRDRARAGAGRPDGLVPGHLGTRTAPGPRCDLSEEKARLRRARGLAENVSVVPGPDGVRRLGPVALVPRAALAPLADGTAWPGVRLSGASDDGARVGFFLATVPADSVAAQLGLVAGDLIGAIDGVVLTDAPTLAAVFRDVAAGDVACFDVFRDGRWGPLWVGVERDVER